MKKTLYIFILIFTFLSLAFPALAQSPVDISPDGLNLGTRDIREVIMSLVNTALGFLGVLAILIFIWGGFKWMLAGANEEKVDEAKRIIISGIIGIIIILGSLSISNFVINAIVSATGAQ